MKVTPDYTLENAPQPAVVVIPAQMGAVYPSETTDAKAAWLRQVGPSAQVILSTCTGAFLLARSGLLDGLQATTHHRYYDQFEAEFLGVTLLRQERFADNGKIVAADGMTSGIDGALHVAARLFGVTAAERGDAHMEHDGDGWRTGERA